MNREEAIQVLQTALTSPFIYGEYADAIEMAIEALSSDAIAKAHNQGFNQGFVEGSVYATVNSNYVCPRCGEKMERKEGGDEE